jgi:hypothetical protein
VVAGAGELDGLRGDPVLVGDGVALRVADGEGDGVAVGVVEGVVDGVVLGVEEGVGGGVVLGVPVGVADGEGAADEPDGDGLGAGDAVAGRTKATVEAVMTVPAWPLAGGPAAAAGSVADVAPTPPDEHAIAATAPAMMAPRMVRTPRFAPRAAAADRAGSSPLPEPADIRPPYIDHPDIHDEQRLNCYIVCELGSDHDIPATGSS